MDSVLQTIETKERTFWTGIVKVRELPRDCTQADFDAWWPHLTEKERDLYTVKEFHNTLTLSGFTQLLTFIATSGVVTYGFSQFFSVGTAPITSVQSGDTSVAGEIYRAAPTTQTIVGNQLTLSTYFGPSQAVGLYTNAGLYGLSATSTLGTGVLFTHTLYNYNKINGQAVSNDYLIVLQ